MLKTIQKAIKSQIHYQLTNMKGVIPEYRSYGKKIFLNSEAGLIEFTPRDIKQLGIFRDKYLNRFNELIEKRLAGEDVSKDFFELYSKIKREIKVKHRANLHTMAKGVVWNLSIWK